MYLYERWISLHYCIISNYQNHNEALYFYYPFIKVPKIFPIANIYKFLCSLDVIIFQII